MKFIHSLKALLEYLGGSRETLPPDLPGFLVSAWFQGLWWSFLLVLILFFSGQKSRFIYIDF